MKKLFKKTLSILPVIALLFVTASTLLFAVACGGGKKKETLSAEDINASEMFSFMLTQKGYAIFRYKGFEGENTLVEIPGKYRGKPVIQILEGAFRGKNITSVIIPASVKEIKAVAFGSCTSLVSVIISGGSQLVEIGSSAFEETKITSITIPASVKSIGEGAFENCQELTTVNFENGSVLETIGKSAFERTKIASIIIPASVRIIENYAFYLCTSLQTMEFAAESSLSIVGTKLPPNIKEIIIKGTENNVVKVCKELAPNLQNISGVTLKVFSQHCFAVKGWNTWYEWGFDPNKIISM